MIEQLTVNAERRDAYETDRNNLMVPDPWSDPFCNKIGLCNMYIESTIAEIMHLSAESEPGVKLNCPNPVYDEYHILLGKVLANKSEADYSKLLTFIETDVADRSLKRMRWIEYVPDIRLLDTVDETMGWLAQHIGLRL